MGNCAWRYGRHRLQLVGLLALGACTTPRIAPDIEEIYISEAEVELEVKKEASGAFVPTGEGALNFAREIDGTDLMTSKLNCSIPIKVTMTGDLAGYQARLKEGLSELVGSDTAFAEIPVGEPVAVTSSIGRLDRPGDQPFNLKLADLIGQYDLKPQGKTEFFFINKLGVYFDAFIANAATLKGVSVTIATADTDATQANALCDKVRTGILYQPAENLNALPDQ